MQEKGGTLVPVTPQRPRHYSASHRTVSHSGARPKSPCLELRSTAQAAVYRREARCVKGSAVRGQCRGGGRRCGRGRVGGGAGSWGAAAWRSALLVLPVPSAPPPLALPPLPWPRVPTCEFPCYSFFFFLNPADFLVYFCVVCLCIPSLIVPSHAIQCPSLPSRAIPAAMQVRGGGIWSIGRYGVPGVLLGSRASLCSPLWPPGDTPSGSTPVKKTEE